MGHEQVLVVDDSAEVAFILGHIGRRAGWDIVSRRDAEQAGTYLGDHQPALLLLDVNLPGANGYEFCRWVRCESAHRDLPVAMFSQWQRSEDIIRALDAGADCVVSKDLLARPNDCRQRLAEILSWAAVRDLPAPVRWQGNSPSVRSLVNEFNRTLRETVASRLGTELALGLLERTAGQACPLAAGAADWLTPDRRGLDTERVERQGSPEAVMTFITSYVEQCWRVLGMAGIAPLWRALGAEAPAAGTLSGKE